MLKVREASSFRSHLLVVQNQNEIYPTIPRDPIIYYKTCTAREIFINTIIFCQLSMQRNQYLPCAIAGLLILPFFHCKATHFHLDKFNYRQIQICDTSRLYSSYKKILKFQM